MELLRLYGFSYRGSLAVQQDRIIRYLFLFFSIDFVALVSLWYCPKDVRRSFFTLDPPASPSFALFLEIINEVISGILGAAFTLFKFCSPTDGPFLPITEWRD